MEENEDTLIRGLWVGYLFLSPSPPGAVLCPSVVMSCRKTFSAFLFETRRLFKEFLRVFSFVCLPSSSPIGSYPSSSPSIRRYTAARMSAHVRLLVSVYRHCMRHEDVKRYGRASARASGGRDGEDEGGLRRRRIFLLLSSPWGGVCTAECSRSSSRGRDFSFLLQPMTLSSVLLSLSSSTRTSIQVEL